MNNRKRQLADAAKVLLSAADIGGRNEVYDAAQRATCKVYKFDAVLREIIEEVDGVDLDG